jgi:hypothetical protein
MRIPITMCHGSREGGDYPLSMAHLDRLIAIAAEEPDAADGGAPISVRYIAKASNPYRLPSMELQSSLINEPDDLRRYFEEALQGS